MDDFAAKCFTKVFFSNTIETSIEEALKIGNNTTTFIRIYWGMELILIYEEINRMLKGIKRYPNARIEKASQRALFYGCKDLGKLKYILNNNLDKLELNENTDINGQKFLEF
jgi:hypothetical protein